jgi:hypothetical protein
MKKICKKNPFLRENLQQGREDSPIQAKYRKMPGKSALPCFRAGTVLPVAGYYSNAPDRI